MSEHSERAAARFFPRAGSHFADVAEGKATMGNAADPAGERQTPNPPTQERAFDLNAAMRAAANRGRVYEPAVARRVAPMAGFGGFGPVVPVRGLPGHTSHVMDSVPAAPRNDLMVALREAGLAQRESRTMGGYTPTYIRRAR